MSWYLNNEDKLIVSSRTVYEGGRYIQADYIEFDWVNNQGYIDVGIGDTSDSLWYADFEYITVGAENWICGTSSLNHNIATILGTASGTSWYSLRNSSYDKPFGTGVRVRATKPTYGSYSYPNHLYIGCRNWANDGQSNPNNSSPSHFKVYWFYVAKSNVVIRNMYPVYDTVNEEWGMYDTINGVFYGNAGGEGTSIAGGYYSEDVTDITPEVLAFDYNDPPASMWHIDDEIIVNGLIPDRLRWQRPYPYSMWFIDHEDNDIIINELLPDILEIPPDGAFTDCRNLRYVCIPKSVKSIGPMTFNGTDLKIVCLSRRCKFSYTSFPSDCKIIYYEDIYPIDYDMLVGGVNAYRITDTIARDEELPTWEIP